MTGSRNARPIIILRGCIMPFDGFTQHALDYFIAIRFDNSKSNFELNRRNYLEHVKAPLCELHAELAPVMLAIDPAICVRRGRCVSGAFNDARFSRADPVKEYMYLHFCAEKNDLSDDVPGFFMDASHDGYRCGLQIYHHTAGGMKTLRDAALTDPEKFRAAIGGIGKSFNLEGEDYKTDRRPDAPPDLKPWLNKKSWWVGRARPIDAAFRSPGLVRELAEGFKTLAPLYVFIVKSLSDPRVRSGRAIKKM